MGIVEGVQEERRLGLFHLMESIHRPFCQQLVRYPAMETHLLRQQLHSIDLVIGSQ